MFLNSFGPEFPNLECGLVVWNDVEKKAIGIKLEDVTIKVRVLHSIAQVDVTQEFRHVQAQGENSQSLETETLDTYYIFPLQPNATVIKFNAEFLDHNDHSKIKRTVQSSVQPIELAKDQYGAAYTESPFMFLTNKNKPPMFKAGLGKLMNSEILRISISYVTELKCLNGSYHLEIPNTLAPNYLTNPRDESPPSIKLSIVGYSQENYKHVFLSSQAQEFEPYINHQPNPLYGFSLELMYQLDQFFQDFKLRIVPENIRKQHLYRERFKDENEEYKNLSILMSNFLFNSDPPVESQTELIFAVDLTQEIDCQTQQIIQTLKLCVHSLPTNCYFNIVSFRPEKCDFLFEESQPFNMENFDSGKQFIAHRAVNLENEVANAELNHSFKDIYKTKYLDGCVKHVFFWTDRVRVDPLEFQELLGIINANAHKSRVFTLGLCREETISQEFLVQIAKVGGGLALFPSNRLELYVNAMTQLELALSDILSNISLNWSKFVQLEDQVEGEIEIVGQYGPRTKIKRDPLETFQSANSIPTKIRPMPTDVNNELILYGVFECSFPTELDITGNIGSHSFNRQCSLVSDQLNLLMESDGLITTMASITLIRDWEKNLSFISPKYHSRIVKKDEDFLKKQLIQLACTKHIPTNFTAYVACDLLNHCQITQEKEFEISESNWIVHSQYLPGAFKDQDIDSDCNSEFSSNERGPVHPHKRIRILHPAHPRLTLLPNVRENDESFINTLDAIFTLIHMMEYNGSFKLTSDVISVIQLDLRVVEQEIARHNLPQTGFATTLVRSFFQKHCWDLKEVWGCTIRKLSKWLQENFTVQQLKEMDFHALTFKDKSRFGKM